MSPTPESLGFAMPKGTDQVSGGDDAIRQNANATVALWEDRTFTRQLLPANSDLDTIAPGLYEVNGTTTAETAHGSVSGVGLPIPVPGTFLNLPAGGNRVQQFLTASSTVEPQEWQRAKIGSTFTQWRRTDTEMRAEIPIGTDLDDLTDSISFYSGGRSRTSTLKNTPTDVVSAFNLEVQNISGTIVLQTITAWSPDGVIIVKSRQALNGVFENWGASAGDEWNRTDPVYMWGDSQVQGGDNGVLWPEGADLPAQLAKHLSVPVVNRGVGGQTTNDILLRAGVIRIHATPAGGSIPASGSVSINMYGQTLETLNKIISVTWAGVNGTIVHNGNEQWTFTRQGSGSAVAITEPTPIFSRQAMTRAGTHVFLMGGNDWSANAGSAPEWTKDDHVFANYQRAIDAVAADPTRHVLVGGVMTRRDTVVGDARWRHVQYVNDALKALYPGLFIDRQAWLVNNALDAAGITPTSEDTDAMAAGLIPPSAFAEGDTTHLNRNIIPTEANVLWATALKRRGWA